ncbi:MAG TPA: DUF5060 domain-containing protein [Opitutaceae bacterium]|nr:DUF5060 domain-containing protein [Opitutaceae bacterium]
MLHRLALHLLAAIAVPLAAADAQVERWGVFELALPGPAGGNPFTEVSLTATFTQGAATHEATGFYDGDGLYRVRFMPETTGEWRYLTHSNRAELEAKAGAFTAVAPGPGNHGPVGVHRTFHFAYADGSPYWQLGTTCYSWTHRTDAREEQTLRTLASSPFNKIRMCVFPQDHPAAEQRFFPYAGQPPRDWDTTRFNPAFFRHLEQRVAQLRDLGIEADLILFHPYGREWGFSSMDAASDDRYLRYLVSRLAAFRNVWWSLSNEYDYNRDKQESDWDRLFQVVQAADPYGHLRSIHNGTLLYNQTLPWVTHASIQNGAAVLDPERAVLYRDVYRKPIVFDEVKYEGDIDRRWGQLSAEELVLRFWNGFVAGTYVGHSEIFRSPADSWLAGGGELRGRSVPRLAFLRRIMNESPPDGIEPIDKWQERRTGGQPGEFYLVYFGTEAPGTWTFSLYKDGLKDGMIFQAEIIDTWNMTITPVPGRFITKKLDAYVFEDAEKKSITLPHQPYLALRLRRVTDSVR